ncbi:unnamed protein product [Somion occarium]|uniref:Uncharacterized protein n=1 Tax=Somion occarium TaxID=3059160 RepID=A0ABP1ECC3_9APHY
MMRRLSIRGYHVGYLSRRNHHLQVIIPVFLFRDSFPQSSNKAFNRSTDDRHEESSLLPPPRPASGRSVYLVGELSSSSTPQAQLSIIRCKGLARCNSVVFRIMKESLVLCVGLTTPRFPLSSFVESLVVYYVNSSVMLYSEVLSIADDA